jgi:hypothetical protein
LSWAFKAHLGKPHVVLSPKEVYRAVAVSASSRRLIRQSIAWLSAPTSEEGAGEVKVVKAFAAIFRLQLIALTLKTLSVIIRRRESPDECHIEMDLNVSIECVNVGPAYGPAPRYQFSASPAPPQ